MTIKNQFLKLKENWLIWLIVLILGFFFLGGSGSISNMANTVSLSKGYGGMAMQEAMVADYDEGSSRGFYPSPSNDFAPEEEERKITKNAGMTTEVERGTFSQAETQLKSIVKSSDSFMLNENVNTFETGRKSYKRGYYSLKVDSEKYDSVIMQLRGIGEVQSFNENANDITGSYVNTEVEIEVEKNRLARYESMYSEADRVEDKIELSDRIFNQERKIKYLEDSLKNMDRRVEYSTVSVTINEERSDYANIVFVKFSELVTKLVDSSNSVLRLIFVMIPYSIAALLIWFIVRLVRRKS